MIKVLLTLYLAISVLLAGNAYAQAATEIYLVRHGETMGNLTHKHTYENDRTLSAKGKSQVAELTLKLDDLSFDYIVVSPKYRTLITILPYLKKHRLKAEVWPELQECCWQDKSRISSFNLQRGAEIQIEAGMRRYFTFYDADARRRYAAKNYGDGLLQIFKAIQLIRKRFAGSGKRILVVTHYHIGARLIEILQGVEPDGRYKLSNAKITHLIEKGDGTFRLISINE